ncbi:MAG: type I-B CRISPR-associated protein Cas7/Csh2 [Candidatus Caldipriscus sp.]
MSILKNRHEILFLYEVVNANPNGDPMDENRPRYDDETGKIFVRDARIKRTIRDTLQEMGEEIFIREERKEDGTLETKEGLFEKYDKDINKVLEKCIDIRLFGGTFALKTGSFSLTGPVQFAYGTSLHRVKILEVQGTSVLPSSDEKGKGKKQGTMMFDYRVAYALIGVYGVANQKTAKETNLTGEDFEKMLKALWIGHRGGSVLITGSKLGHKSLMLLDIVHTEDSLDLIGSLDRYVKIKPNAEINDEEAIRSPKDYILDISELGEKVKALKGRNRLEKVRYILDEDLRVEPSIEKAFEGIKLEKLEF